MAATAHRIGTFYNRCHQIHFPMTLLPMRKRNSKTQTIRISGGKWRGRKITFPEIADLRPTLGKTKETLFNWLRPEIKTTRCLDLFAGSGSLGIEAMSQGAGHVILVDSDAYILRCLEENINRLCPQSCEIIRADAIAYLEKATSDFDIIFLDPPFNQPELLAASLEVILGRKLMKKYVYVESNRQELVEEIILTFKLKAHRTTSGGQAFSALLTQKDS
jgi:16S rRNA (guanine966-N2)-methyltransferase